MIVREYSTQFNALVMYVVGVTNTIQGRMKIFVQGPQVNLAKKVMVREHVFATYFKALNRAIR